MTTPKDHTATQGASESSEREVFEAAMRKHRPNIDLRRHPGDYYIHDRTLEMWRGWQACVEYRRQAALAQRQPAPADPQAPSQEARSVDHLPGTTGDSLEDAMKWAASQEAREYLPTDDTLAGLAAKHGFRPRWTGDQWLSDAPLQMRSLFDLCREVVESDRKARQQEERCIRRLLCLRIGGALAYMDDGEAQYAEHGIAIDFLREPAADIEAKVCALNVARAAIAKGEQSHG